MKIFLDDIRTVDVELNYFVVRDYETCIKVVSALRNVIKFISLDYNLGNEKTGFDVLVYMLENEIYPNHINIHSDYDSGIFAMRSYIIKNFPDSIKLTFNKIML